MHDLSAWNVLVVDDEPHNAGILEHILQFYDARVRIADSGVRCLEMLREERPTVLLLDVHMPKMSGFDVLQAIREDESLHNLPVIAVTALAMPGERERILQAGFDAYMAKPIDTLSLVDQIMGVIRTRQAMQPNKHPEP